jgi:hypothetical protein
VLGTPPAFILSQDQTLRKFTLNFQGPKFRVPSYHSSVVKVLPQKGVHCITAPPPCQIGNLVSHCSAGTSRSPQHVRPQLEWGSLSENRLLIGPVKVHAPFLAQRGSILAPPQTHVKSALACGETKRRPADRAFSLLAPLWSGVCSVVEALKVLYLAPLYQVDPALSIPRAGKNCGFAGGPNSNVRNACARHKPFDNGLGQC